MPRTSRFLCRSTLEKKSGILKKEAPGHSDSVSQELFESSGSSDALVTSSFVEFPHALAW